jgi:hypothetical protein
MTNVFAVVGEHRREPERLLLLGEDGRYYAYRADGAPMQVEPGAAWNLDEEALAAAMRTNPAPVRAFPQASAGRAGEAGAEGRRRAAG